MNKDEVVVVSIQDNTEEAKINKGVRQGYILSSIIFNGYIQESINKVSKDTSPRIKINKQRISMLSFADDIALITEDKKDLEKIISIIN